MGADKLKPGGIDPPEQVVLIIDDDPNTLDIMTRYLEDRHYAILIAEDGESGLKRADYAKPDLILLDIMMPGIDGFETCRRLKAMESTREIPVIFMTALAEPEHKVRGFEAGAVDYVTKPIQREEVVARVGLHLRLRELTAGLQKANESLNRFNEELEQRVGDRTKKLERRSFELEQMNKAFIGRELKMVELKERIKELEKRPA
jgi:DNA-binding response OmpR family regulator